MYYMFSWKNYMKSECLHSLFFLFIYRDAWGLFLGNNEFSLNSPLSPREQILARKKSTGNIVFTVKELFNCTSYCDYHSTFSSVSSLLHNCVTIFPLRHRAIISMNISISEVHQWSNDISTATIFLSLNLFQVTS